MGGEYVLKNLSYKVIGLMSGTSLDGLDLAYCHIGRNEGNWSFDFIETKAVNYDASWRESLKNTIYLDSLNLLALDVSYGQFLGEQVRDFINDIDACPDLIASHGHTVFHQPEKGFTRQIGSGQEIANVTGFKTISDFRSKDVSLGGQGAPLVPIGDHNFFGEYDACLNLGGIANVSYDSNGVRLAMDICAANMLLNCLMEEIGKMFDDNGSMARSGKVIPEMLESLNALAYLTIPGPKSTGVEWFNQEIVAILKRFSGEGLEDRLHTSVEHMAMQIAKVSQSFSSMLVTGGGAKNGFLMERIAHHLGFEPNIPVEQVVDFKEALVFALMGVLRNENETNCFHSVTGAKYDSSGGVVYLP